jgi:AcrR family transcriptional regulator
VYVVPYPRFNKLAEARRTHLLDVAAQEFAANGLADASINRILERAGMSKGAAYYYFEDKVDLFTTVVENCAARLRLIDQTVNPAELDAATFWPTFAELHRQPLLRSFDQPWLFGALKSARRLPVEALQREPLARLAERLTTYVMTFVRRGQVLGVIRTDLPGEVLFAWLEGLDRASDDWLLAHWHDLDREDIARISDQTVEAMRRAVAP